MPFTSHKFYKLYAIKLIQVISNIQTVKEGKKNTFFGHGQFFYFFYKSYNKNCKDN